MAGGSGLASCYLLLLVMVIVMPITSVVCFVHAVVQMTPANWNKLAKCVVAAVFATKHATDYLIAAHGNVASTRSCGSSTLTCPRYHSCLLAFV